MFYKYICVAKCYECDVDHVQHCKCVDPALIERNIYGDTCPCANTAEWVRIPDMEAECDGCENWSGSDCKLVAPDAGCPFLTESAAKSALEQEERHADNSSVPAQNELHT